MASLLDSDARRTVMPQVLKAEVRERILAAALAEFAAKGFPFATMASIAERAGMGTAGIYRYYPSKDALFHAVVPASLAETFEQLLAKRVRSLGTVLGQDNNTGNEMLSFWQENRLAVVILLDRAQGTPLEHFGARFVDHLVELTATELKQPGLDLDAPPHFVLRRIFENTRLMIAAILEEFEDPEAIRAAIEVFWAYQIAGLHGFAKKVMG
jgi:AcrR family transcriptional regulator